MRLLQPRGPIGNQQAVGRTRNWVLRHPVRRREEPRHEITILSGGGRDDSFRIQPGQRREIGIKRRDLGLSTEHPHVVVRHENIRRRRSKPAQKRIGRFGALGGKGREIEIQQIIAPYDGQFAGCGRKEDLAVLGPELFEEHISGRQRRVAAQFHFHRRREPAQFIAAPPVIDKERRLGQIVLGGDRLQRLVR